jgi:hypothetical protein
MSSYKIFRSNFTGGAPDPPACHLTLGNKSTPDRISGWSIQLQESFRLDRKNWRRLCAICDCWCFHCGAIWTSYPGTNKDEKSFIGNRIQDTNETAETKRVGRREPFWRRVWPGQTVGTGDFPRTRCSCRETLSFHRARRASHAMHGEPRGARPRQFTEPTDRWQPSSAAPASVKGTRRLAVSACDWLLNPL